MTQIAVAPYVFKDCLLKIGTDNYEKHVSSVTLTPSSSIQTWKGGTPDATFSDATSPTWTADLGYAQDWETANSLSLYLLNHQGEKVEMEFTPKNGGPSFTVLAIIVAGAIGGAVDAYQASTVSLGVEGQPVFAAPAEG